LFARTAGIVRDDGLLWIDARMQVAQKRVVMIGIASEAKSSANASRHDLVECGARCGCRMRGAAVAWRRSARRDRDGGIAEHRDLGRELFIDVAGVGGELNDALSAGTAAPRASS